VAGVSVYLKILRMQLQDNFAQKIPHEMHFMRARYLVRFDDICPTMNWETWAAIENILLELKIQPILAVVPDNQDPHLQVAPARPDFWQQVRRWQSRGWTIGLHGYQHRYVTTDAGIVGLNHYSEFAGLPASEQEAKLQNGLAIFQRERVRAEIWVAPAHAFDPATVAALKKFRLNFISDGFFVFPRIEADGMLWVPQQLWGFRPLPFGVWTVCYHHNEWTPGDIEKFRQDLRQYKDAITNFSDVVRTAPDYRGNYFVPAVNAAFLAAMTVKHKLRQWRQQK